MSVFHARSTAQRFAAAAVLVGICVAVGVIGCAGQTGSGPGFLANPYAGQYEGSLSGDSAALFSVTVNAQGQVSGTLTDGQTKQMSGSVNEVGDATWTATPPSPEAEVTYLLDGSCDSSGCSGTWFGTTGLNGNWTGSKTP
ncbi:MAG: hypothetical protein KF784_06815 [Fimbriimonadaceae bacterium]|nr:hypothetical protein [Fimbriimonadaceae bacterium]